MLHVNWEPLLYTIGQSKQKLGMSSVWSPYSCYNKLSWKCYCESDQPLIFIATVCRY